MKQDLLDSPYTRMLFVSFLPSARALLVRAHKVIAIGLFLFTFSNGNAYASGQKVYGKDPSKNKVQPLSTLIARYSQIENKSVLSRGKVEKVCKKKGCWMMIKDGKVEMRVTFKDYGFFVPEDLLGKDVVLEGQLVRKIIPVDEARHYLEDEGAPASEIAKITKPTEKYRFIATGVKG